MIPLSLESILLDRHLWPLHGFGEDSERFWLEYDPKNGGCDL